MRRSTGQLREDKTPLRCLKLLLKFQSVRFLGEIWWLYLSVVLHIVEFPKAQFLSPSEFTFSSPNGSALRTSLASYTSIPPLEVSDICWTGVSCHSKIQVKNHIWRNLFLSHHVFFCLLSIIVLKLLLDFIAFIWVYISVFYIVVCVFFIYCAALL